MPDLARAFPTVMGPKLSAGTPPVEQARALVDEVYFDEEVLAIILDREPTKDLRGGFRWEEVARGTVRCHVTKVSNQRGAFTQGSTSSAGHGPLTSAMLWYAFFPMGTAVEIGDTLLLPSGTKLAIIGRADEANWRVMEAFRCTELGIDQ
jgi:hypothetical protein